MTWRPLEEDFEFDEDIPQYSAPPPLGSEKKKVSRPKLVKHINISKQTIYKSFGEVFVITRKYSVGLFLYE